MPGRRAALVLLLVGLLLGDRARPHAPSQFSAWTRLVEVDLQPEAVHLRYGLAAGASLGLAQRQRLDHNSDGLIDDSERSGHAAELARLLSGQVTLRVDGATVPLAVDRVRVLLDEEPRVLPAPLHLEFEWHAPLVATPTRRHSLELDDRLVLPALLDTRVDIAEQGGTRLEWSQLDGGPRLARRVFDFVRAPPDRPYRLSLVFDEMGGVELARAASARPSAGDEARGNDEVLGSLLRAPTLAPRLVVLALLLAFALGALHALAPGHGKTLVAAYLVGQRGTVGQAVLLGLVVTATHVASVLILGVITLWLSVRLLPGQLVPWLELGSGALVLALGLWMLGLRGRAWRRQRLAVTPRYALARSPRAGFVLQARHLVVPSPGAGGDRGVVHPPHDHTHDHDHLPRAADGQPAGLWEILVLGVTGGMVPCPSALVVLLTAVALQRIALGLLLIAVFSLGLASVLMAIGILVVKARSLLERLRGAGHLLRALPVVSAGLVTLLGLALVLASLGAAIAG
jgi:ABC-type nickel/cobalt efflux system permease component RcnA